LRRIAFDEIPPGVGDLRAEFAGHALCGLLDLFDEAAEVVAGVGDGYNADGGALPGDGFIELGYGDVEALAKLVFEGADYLAAVFEGLGVIDAEFEGELGYGHKVREQGIGNREQGTDVRDRN
jgi:hypothetical protein